ncbi:hypothetical protein L6452_33247 [Arctium lappa]|uniref:Uncharacterized protein n=1 Tax=Arctium lappa TaxID=4217 RepID=A0ACB8Z5X4_ARCLA|nr:hypothetical protein L6452_33247 [Arctium lappa]
MMCFLTITILYKIISIRIMSEIFWQRRSEKHFQDLLLGWWIEIEPKSKLSGVVEPNLGDFASELLLLC